MTVGCWMTMWNRAVFPSLIWVSGVTPDSCRSNTTWIPAVVVLPQFYSSIMLMRFLCCPNLTSSPTSSDIHLSRIGVTQWIAFLTVVGGVGVIGGVSCVGAVGGVTPFDIAYLPKLIWVHGETPDSIRKNTTWIPAVVVLPQFYSSSMLMRLLCCPDLTSSSTSCDIHPAQITDTP